MRAVGLWILCLVLAACAGDPPRAPVEARRGVQKTRPAPQSYTVVRGDTLYAIAWRYGMDYRELARLNDISRPYTIFPGQTLSLRAGPSSRPSVAPPAAASLPDSSPRTAPQPKPAASSRPSATNAAVDTWVWPADGKVVSDFSGTVHKGIDIAGEAGDSVRSTAAGRVVYAGGGIGGYGKLVIVKHNDLYLSAYGHNRRLLVKEGEQVSTGQRIAEKGSSGTNSVKLHFEIRREGKPVDPLTLLRPR